ncbi:MAG: hypothetical protein DMD76_13800 [Candidatus Rokuibacteriota bacterium]|nr:MAG: hypothetical protein DMD76_13800 [Candidatus Rokubacteria bacterium]
MGGTSMRLTGNGSRRRRILVVDDEPAFAELMADFFSGLPGSPSVTVAGNGLAALDAVHREMPDVVLLDLKMPVMNGLDVMKRMHEVDPTLPILVISGTDSRMANQAFRAGAFGYVPKPTNLRYVEHLVEEAVARRRT